MISTSIDGSNVNGASHLLDLLSLVSNPAVYEAKVKALQDAAEENKKYVEAVAPVSEILKLRDDTRAAAENARVALEQAHQQAAELVDAAKQEAAGVVEQAKKDAAEVRRKAKALADSAAGKLADAQAAQAKADAAVKAAERLAEAATQREAAAVAAQAAAEQAKEEADAARADIMAKHQAFISRL